MAERTCSIEGCERAHLARGLCSMHYQRLLADAATDPRPPKACSVDGCDKPAKYRLWCVMHYRRWQRNGDPLANVKAAPGTHRWIDKKGYVHLYRPDHPLASATGYVLEHRMVAWDAGLFDDPSLVVHHKNEIKDDNRLENLEAKPNAEHSREHDTPGRANRAKTHCPAGHPYDEVNTRVRPDGRECKACRRIRGRQRPRF